MKQPRPPQLVRCALWLFLAEQDRRVVWSELGELYERRRAREGSGAAAVWYRRQTIQYPLRLLADRLGAGGRMNRKPESGSGRRRLRSEEHTSELQSR